MFINKAFATNSRYLFSTATSTLLKSTTITTMSAQQQVKANSFIYNPGSVFSNVGVLLLHEKKVQDQFEFVAINMSIDNIAPWYIKLNPKGQVPTLVHEGQAVPDTLDIAKYLDKTVSPAIFALDDPKPIEIVEKWRSVRPLSLVQGKKSPDQDVSQMQQTLAGSRQQVLTYMQENPDLEEAYKTRLAIHDNRSQVLLDHDTHLLHKEGLQRLLQETEQTLKENNGQLLSDKSYSIADVYATGILYWLHTKLSKDILKDYPYLATYYKQQTSRHSFIQSFSS